MPRILIGRTHDLYGKSIWELVCNLKDFGVGRVIVKTKNINRYPEPSWYRILKAEPLMDKDNLKGHLTVEEVYRGVKRAKPRVMSRVTAQTDYQLVPKHREHEVCKVLYDEENSPMKELPEKVPKPPLLLALERQNATDASPVDNSIPAVYRTKHHKKIHLEYDENAPNIDLGTPIHPQLYT